MAPLDPPPPLSDSGKCFLGLSADEKFSLPPSAQVHLGHNFSSKTQDQREGVGVKLCLLACSILAAHTPTQWRIREGWRPIPGRGGGVIHHSCGRKVPMVFLVTDEPNFFPCFCADRMLCPRALAQHSFGA